MFTCTYDDYEEIQKLMLNFSPLFNQELIFFTGYFRYYDFKLLGDLFELTGKPQTIFRNSSFSMYLLARQLITPDDIRGNRIITPEPVSKIESDHSIKDKSFEFYIKNDDVRGFIDLSITNNLCIVDKHIIINGRNNDILLHTVCIFGALNILKYLIINNVQLDDEVAYFAVEGGSEDIIELLVAKGISFDSKLQIALQSHQNSIAKWLIENYVDNFFRLPNIVDYFNSEMLIYFLETLGWNISTYDFQHRTCLHLAVIYDEIALAHYLIAHKINQEITDNRLKKAIHYCKSDEMRNFLSSIESDNSSK